MGKTPRTCGALPRLAALVLSAAVLSAAAGPARAQAGPRLRLGDNPKAYDDARAKKHALLVTPKDTLKRPAILWLRPNQESAFYLYVENPSLDDETVKVKLLAADGTAVAESAEQVIPGKENGKDLVPRRVSLAAAPPKEPAPKEPAAKPAAAVLVNGHGLPPQFEIQLLAVTKDKTTQKKTEALVERVAVGIMVPDWYVKPTAVYNGADKRLSVTVAPIPDIFAGPDCRVELEVFLPDPKTGLPVKFTTPKEGTFDRALALDRGAVELTVVDPRLAVLADKDRKQSYVTLNVDGYKRAFRFEGGFEAKSGDTPLPRLTDPSLFLRVPEAWATGADCPVRLGVDDILGTLPVDELAVEVTLRVDFGRLKGDGSFDVYWTDRLAGHRFQQVSVNPHGPDGALVLRTDVHDWDVTLPTKGVVGTRDVRVQVLKKGPEKETALPVRESRSDADRAVYRAVVLDTTPPEITKLGVRREKPEASGPAKVERGAGKLPLFAVGSDPESGIKQVAFFVGKPAPDPKVPDSFKLPEGAVLFEGLPAKGEPLTWLASVPVTAEKPGTVDVSVQFVNKAGLVTFGTLQVELVEPKAPPKTGSIAGKVTEGDRPQAGVEVTLRDGANALKGATTTDKAGTYIFKDLPPGAYRVAAVKTTAGTRGDAPAQVEAREKPTTADIKLSR